MVECKKDKIPLSYVNAFEEPVSIWGSNPNLVKNSVEKLVDHINNMDYAYELPIVHRAFFAPRYSDKKPNVSEVFDQFTALIQSCVSWLQEDENI